MNNQELQEMLLLQTNITTIILVFTAIILIGITIDLFFYLFNKYKDKTKKDIK